MIDGGVNAVVVIDAEALVERLPSLTVSVTTYVPTTSVVNTGCTTVGLSIVAALPAGLLVNSQLYVSVPPPFALLPVPSSSAAAVAGRVVGTLTLATGGGLLVLVPLSPLPHADRKRTTRPRKRCRSDRDARISEGGME